MVTLAFEVFILHRSLITAQIACSVNNTLYLQLFVKNYPSDIFETQFHLRQSMHENGKRTLHKWTQAYIET